MKYITKHSPHIDLYNAYRESQEEIKRLNRLHKNSKEKKIKVIKNKNIQQREKTINKRRIKY